MFKQQLDLEAIRQKNALLKAARWRDCAEYMRTKAASMQNEANASAMLRLAQDFVFLAACEEKAWSGRAYERDSRALLRR
jgi:hypothetical protein